MLHTLDINEEYTAIAKRYFNKSNYNNRIQQHIGNALDIIPDLGANFQLAFIDADKENYSSYFDLIIDKIDVGGYIIADNVLWSGKVTKKQKTTETGAVGALRVKYYYYKAILGDFWGIPARGVFLGPKARLSPNSTHLHENGLFPSTKLHFP